MDMKRIRRQPYTSSDPLKGEGDGDALSFSSHGKKHGFQISIPVFLLLVCFVGVTLFLVTSGVHRSDFIVTIAGASGAGGEGGGETDTVSKFRNSFTNQDKTLGGLLAASGFDDQSCLSRYRTGLYRRNTPHKPSRHLVQRLRAHESLQKRCGPGTRPYQKAVEQLRSGQTSKIDQDCNYLVWISYSGLGNRILTAASAFLYSLLTNRVLLVDRGKDMDDLFCEPFPETSWFLPFDFPLKDKLSNFSITSEESYGNMLKNQVGVDKANFVYLHLDHDYNDNDKLFFCEEDQKTIQNARWLILRSDVYFVPSLFLNSLFEDELNELFPAKDMVFHHLGRYLFHPTNAVWGLITRYYDSYMAKADERVGIQVRVFEVERGPFQHVLDQIISCTQSEGLLPQTVSDEIAPPATNPKMKVVLFTSLGIEYYEHVRSMYWEKPTSSGEIVSVFQPSYEGYQQSGKKNHNRKAWAEMYLLSLTDKLVTSGWSTFGYVAQGLGGLKPWIMFRPENRTVPNPPCRRDVSMEPCFHSPPYYDCKKKEGTDTGNLVPHVRHCNDISWGLKIVD
ncbi:fucosyltransferase 2 [Rhynchospora pubera]|uniref:Fucosyltransferase n=1 Tax=Rhynchospora pubera TaxID=906938 RepID=A0AAV8DET7_9POAL|nr:fucosyltransferase 2 [Rhynchospora pubera]